MVGKDDEKDVSGENTSGPEVSATTTTEATAVRDENEESSDEEAIRRLAEELKFKFHITDTNDGAASRAPSKQPSASSAFEQQQQSVPPSSEGLGHSGPGVPEMRLIARGTSSGLESSVDLAVSEGNNPRIDLAAPSLYFSHAKELAVRYRQEHYLTAVNTFDIKKILAEFEEDSQDDLGKLVILMDYFGNMTDVLKFLSEVDDDPSAGRFAALFRVGNDGIGVVQMREIVSWEDDTLVESLGEEYY